MELVYLVILIALIEYIVFTALVGRARARYGIKAPACSGNDAFERTFRVQQNTLEWLIVFLPAIWLFGLTLSTTVAAIAGVIGVIGRAWYARGYIADADKRGPGAVVSGLVNLVLVIGSLVGVVRGLI